MAKKSGKTAKTKVTKKTNAAKLAPKPVLSSWAILWQSAKLVLEHRRLLLGIIGVYGLLSLIFQGGGLFSVNNLTNLGGSRPNQSIAQSAAHSFAAIVGAGTDASNGAASVLQFVLMIVVSLVLIWTLRHIYTGQAVKVKEAYYKGPGPFVPFLLVLIILAFQLLPLVLGSSLYQIMITNSIAVNGLERALSALVALALTVPTFYWLASSIFALYIVTLPDMTPITALRSAKELVQGRRLLVLRKLILLPFVLIGITTILLVPVIFFVPVLSAPLFFVTTTITFLVMHTYLYSLYRELLGE
jgi:hypothetical protein